MEQNYSDDGWISSINRDVIIDFDVPKDIANIIDMCETLDKDHDYVYLNYADLLSIICKEAYVQGHISKKQWDTLEMRYTCG